MKITYPFSSASTSRDEALPPQPSSASAAFSAAPPERQHHGNSADLLRRFAAVGQAAPVDSASQAAPLNALAQTLCLAMKSSHPQRQLAEALPAAWHDVAHPAQAQVVVRRAWPFVAGDCVISAASMHCRADDGTLQQLYLTLGDVALDLSAMERQFGKLQAQPAYQDGGPDDVLYANEQAWGRLGVVSDAAGTRARALLLEPRPASAQ